MEIINKKKSITTLKTTTLKTTMGKLANRNLSVQVLVDSYFS